MEHGSFLLRVTMCVYGMQKGTRRCKFSNGTTTLIHSAAFSPDNKRIICSSTYQTCAWDASTGQSLSIVRNPEHPFSLITGVGLQDTIGITQLGFILDFKTGRMISRLLPMLPSSSITASASNSNSLIFGTDTGRVFIMHFPPFANFETQISAPRDDTDKNNHLPVELYYANVVDLY